MPLNTSVHHIWVQRHDLLKIQDMDRNCIESLYERWHSLHPQFVKLLQLHGRPQRFLEGIHRLLHRAVQPLPATAATSRNVYPIWFQRRKRTPFLLNCLQTENCYRAECTRRHRPVNEMEIRHLLAELLMKLLDDRSSQQLLGGEAQNVSENNRVLNVLPRHHSDPQTHKIPQNIHRSFLTLLVLTQAQDESSEERNNGAWLVLSVKQIQNNYSWLSHL